MDEKDVRELMAVQDGVISRAQALDHGFTDADLRRLLRRREWARLHPGVYVEHTGPPTWQQRAWAAVLFATPAALCAQSALRAADGPGRRDHDDSGPIQVAVDHARTVVTPAGVVARRFVGLEARTQWNLSPPRVRIEEAVIDVAAGAVDDHAAIAVLADAVQSRRTTTARLSAVLERRTRIARRDFLEGVLDDVHQGACSTLEHAFLSRVERAHGLPVGQRQVKASSRGPVYRDVLYESWGFVVELDGSLDHTRAPDRDRDLERDLDAALDQLLTVRLGWGQVVGRPCVTATKLTRILRRRGWRGTSRPCRTCRDPDAVDSQSVGDWKSTR